MHERGHEIVTAVQRVSDRRAEIVKAPRPFKHDEFRESRETDGGRCRSGHEVVFEIGERVPRLFFQ